MWDLLEVLENVKSTPGGVIRAHRKNFKITLRDLSKITGIAESNLSLIENDKVEIGSKRARLIAAALGIDPSFIMFPNGYEPYRKEVEKVRSVARRFLSSKKRAPGTA
jgi:transcriptional regulator with XRE-family HTH domain